MGVWIETSRQTKIRYLFSVTPFVGVWIETMFQPKKVGKNQSHPSWVCGLKHHQSKSRKFPQSHTLRGCVDWNPWLLWGWFLWYVTPFVGVWIETGQHMSNQMQQYVTPFVGVWIETLEYLLSFHKGVSHPSWVCGLKPLLSYINIRISLSHPSWVCGLKLNKVHISFLNLSHTLRGCVDWNTTIKEVSINLRSHTLRGCVDWNFLVCLQEKP